MDSRGPASPEFSRPVDAEEIGAGGRALEFAATPAERTALARRFGLDGLDRLEGRARLQPLGDGRVRLEVTFSADVLQSCVITLEPVASQISERFEVVYAPATEDGDEAEVFVDALGEDPPEALADGGIDVGEVTAQHLALLIEPYPRAAEAEGESGSWRTDGAAEDAAVRDSPFERLRDWKARA